MRRMFLPVLTLGVALVLLTATAEEPKTKPADEARIAAQGICPVTGVKLGEHGTPVASKIDGESLFLCCAACVDKPAKPEHLKTVHANLAKAQATCPITGKPVKESSPSLVVEERTVFVCCPGCPGKVKADPAAAIAKVDAQYEKAAATTK